MKMKTIGPRGESIPGATLGSANAFMPNVSLKVFLTVVFKWIVPTSLAERGPPGPVP